MMLISRPSNFSQPHTLSNRCRPSCTMLVCKADVYSGPSNMEPRKGTA